MLSLVHIHDLCHVLCTCLLLKVTYVSVCIFIPVVCNYNDNYGSVDLDVVVVLILGVKVTTPTCMVLGEVGRYPIEIEAKCRMLGFWYGLCSTSHSESPKISNLMFQLCSKLYYASDYKLPWLMKVHSLLDSLGLSYIWSNQIHTIESLNV